MIATTHEILDRPNNSPSLVADLRKDFRLGEIEQVPVEIILENPNVSLYGLDFRNRSAVFVEIPADTNLSHAPFYFNTQFQKAKRVLTIPFETMIKVSKSVTIDDDRLIFIYSVGRCGSTLASQIFAQIPGVINISEPFALSQLVIARNTRKAREDELVALLEAAIRLLCKTEADTAWVVKGQSFVIELGDWLHNIYPYTKNLFLYRHAETWLESGLRAFSRGVEETDEEKKIRRELLGSLVPAIAQYDAELTLSHTGILSLMWLTAMEQYVQYSRMGIEMLAIRYASWLSAPRKTAEAMLEYCGCKPADMTAIYETLNRDSQADSHLSREALQQHNRTLDELELEELHRHLQKHDFIHEADFEVPNTLKV
ncbi:MAG: hypothetical protein JSW42_04535 [Chloroflexota bacterium]|nr:MAG: hypothetical protein JSW42_04535 [Chloroflexota bacterium]